MSDQPAVFPGTYPGTITSPPDIAGLLAAADLTCVGSVTAVLDEGPVTYVVWSEPLAFSRQTAEVAVERTFSGSAGEDPVRVRFLVPDAVSTMTVLTRGERVALFLRRRGDGYELVDETTSKIDLTAPARGVVAALDEARRSSDPEVAAVAAGLLEALGKP